jgi:hypothetical protein
MCRLFYSYVELNVEPDSTVNSEQQKPPKNCPRPFHTGIPQSEKNDKNNQQKKNFLPELHYRLQVKSRAPS